MAFEVSERYLTAFEFQVLTILFHRHLGTPGDWSHVPERENEGEKEEGMDTGDEPAQPLEECVR